MRYTIRVFDRPFHNFLCEIESDNLDHVQHYAKRGKFVTVEFSAANDK